MSRCYSDGWLLLTLIASDPRGCCSVGVATAFAHPLLRRLLRKSLNQVQAAALISVGGAPEVVRGVGTWHDRVTPVHDVAPFLGVVGVQDVAANVLPRRTP